VISFRFHIVSIVAVFLALAIGIVVGSTVIDRAIVDSLRDRVEDVNSNLDEREEANQRLNARLNDLDAFVEDAAAITVDQRLANTVAVVVTDRGVDRDPVNRTIELLSQSGAAVRGVLTVDPSWSLEDEETRVALADSLELDAAEPVEVLQERAASLLVTDLASAVEVVDDGTGALDLIADLQLVDFEIMDDVLANRPNRVLFVVVTGPATDVSDSDHMTDFVEIASETVGSVVQAESWVETPDGPDRADSLASVLGDPTLAADVSTVDTLDLPMGPTTVVLALIAAQAGEVGHYGVGDGATAAAPPPPGTP
jgi:hypothetical protein